MSTEKKTMNSSCELPTCQELYNPTPENMKQAVNQTFAISKVGVQSHDNASDGLVQLRVGHLCDGRPWGNDLACIETLQPFQAELV